MARSTLLARMHRFAHHPYANLLAGAILLITGLLEGLATLLEGLFDWPIGSHYGVAVFGFLQMIKAFPDTFKGLKFLDEGEESLVQAAVGRRVPR